MLIKMCALVVSISLALTASTAAANDINAKLFLTKAGPDGAPPDIVPKGAYKDWSKSYHKVVALTANQVGFYRRTDGLFRVISFGAGSIYSTVHTTHLAAGYDDVIIGEFVGSASRPDILLFKRSSREVEIYEYNKSAPAIKHSTTTTLDKTKNGGSFDLVAAGYLGQSSGKHDIFFYNKTEGSARVYRMSGDKLVTQKSFSGMARNWDAIIPADIDGDAYTDFAFYNQDGGGVVGAEDKIAQFSAIKPSHTNPLNGTVKMMSLGADLTWTVINVYHDSWPMHANVRVIPGQFGGDTRTDFLVYEGDPDGASKATYWINKNGAYAALPPVTNWQGRWTDIVPLRFDRGLTDLFFYTRQVNVPVLLVVDNDGGGSDGVTFPLNEILSDFTSMLPLVNRAFAPSGVHFIVNPNVLTFDMDSVGGEDATPVGKACYNAAAKDKLEALATFARSSYPKHLVSFVRRGGGSKSCGSATTTFFVMAPPRNTNTTVFGRDGSSTPLAINPKLFAHELGHTFSLIHTQRGKYLGGASANDRYVFSNDDPGVGDTPPNPKTKTIVNSEPSPWSALSIMCDDSGNNDLSIAGQSYTLNPERHEIMSTGINCDSVYRITPDQASAIHTNRLARPWVNQD